MNLGKECLWGLWRQISSPVSGFQGTLHGSIRAAKSGCIVVSRIDEATPGPSAQRPMRNKEKGAQARACAPNMVVVIREAYRCLLTSSRSSVALACA